MDEASAVYGYPEYDDWKRPQTKKSHESLEVEYSLEKLNQQRHYQEPRTNISEKTKVR